MSELCTSTEIENVSKDRERPDPIVRVEPQMLEIGLSAAMISVHKNEPEVLVVRGDSHGRSSADALPYGPFSPTNHRTLEIGLRDWVQEQTGLSLGYVEQLYTFGDRGRHAQLSNINSHIVSIGYLALIPSSSDDPFGAAQWNSWYDYFPWEDWRHGKPALLADTLEPLLMQWANFPQSSLTKSRSANRIQRLRIAFGFDGGSWDEEKVLERYEILYEAGLVDEARRDGCSAASHWQDPPDLGLPMRFDHRRILATSMARLRAKIKYRPVIFELMDQNFTLFELQKVVEAILGPHLHKQNFRRLVETAGLVQPTGEVRAKTGGRPAKLYRFRPEVVLERTSPGVRVKAARI